MLFCSSYSLAFFSVETDRLVFSQKRFSMSSVDIFLELASGLLLAESERSMFSLEVFLYSLG